MKGFLASYFLEKERERRREKQISNLIIQLILLFVFFN